MLLITSRTENLRTGLLAAAYARARASYKLVDYLPFTLDNVFATDKCLCARACVLVMNTVVFPTKILFILYHYMYILKLSVFRYQCILIEQFYLFLFYTLLRTDD